MANNINITMKETQQMTPADAALKYIDGGGSHGSPSDDLIESMSIIANGRTLKDVCYVRESVEILAAEVRRLRELTQWRRSSEILPKCDLRCFVAPQMQVCVFSAHYQWWDDGYGDDFCFNIEDVTHWMPLPAAPGKEKL